MSLPRYPEYKDSGVEWLGKVPRHWQLFRLKEIAQVVNGYPFDSKLFEPDGTYPLVRIRDLNAAETATRYSGDFVLSAAVTSSDVLIGMDGDFNVGRWLGTDEALLNQRMCCVRTRSPALSSFVCHALPIPLRAINDVTYSTTVKHLSSIDVEKIRFALPESDEVVAIAAFLDRETAKIDALIAEQEKLIALLAEKRQATISHAVTRGLNPDAPTKGSGMPWLEKMPSHWQLKRLKNISPFITVGIVVNPSDYVSDEGLPFIYGGDILEGRVLVDTARRITAEGSARQEKTKLRAGDLLTVRVGAPGVTAVVPESAAGGNCASVMLTRRGDFDSNWLCYAMNSRMVRYQVEVVKYGAAQEQFNIGHAVNFWVAVPPRSEQAEIAEFLSTELVKLDSLRTTAESAITLLRERRSALIAAAVTGQIDVRAVAPQPRRWNLPHEVAAWP